MASLASEWPKTKSHIMKNNDLQNVKQLLDSAEANIRQARSLLFAADLSKKAKELPALENSSIVEGVFNGEEMVDAAGKIYPIPANYASKSKLVYGDVLKLTILPDGSFVFKQIGPVRRNKVVGVLDEFEPGKYLVKVGKKSYRVLLASITYFKVEAGDKVTIIIPEEGESEWAAVENAIVDA